mgnify:CR=1 FL=1
MATSGGTRTQSVDPTGRGREPGEQVLPGLLLIFSQGQPCNVPLPLRGGHLELGRGEPGSGLPTDPRMSRRHARVSFDGIRFEVSDLGSHNGSYCDGVPITARHSESSLRVLRTGESLFLFCADLRPYVRSPLLATEDRVAGPGLQAVLGQVARAAHYGRNLHITGESGSGKEGIARAFHSESTLAAGPFVAINCATIASGVAERLLFGSKRGAFSGAVADAEGLIQSADGGTLFLDEIGELDPAVQAKLLRVLETGEVLPMGALRARRVQMQLCSASHRDLRSEVSEGRFREDLYFRVSRPEVVVPPLRRRLDEIPWFCQRAIQGIAPKLQVGAPFVEACLLRHWPGNVRELLSELRAAAQNALGETAPRLEVHHLDPRAGQPIQKAPEPALSCAMLLHPPLAKLPLIPDRARVEEVLRQAGGNISAAARALGLHRTQLRRLMEKYGIKGAAAGHELEQEAEGEE